MQTWRLDGAADTYKEYVILPLTREDFRKEAMIQKRPRVEGRLEGGKIYIYIVTTDLQCCVPETSRTFKAIILQLIKTEKT